MKPFGGFPARARYTGIPALFFSAVLPAIDDLAELKVTLHVFWLLAHKPGSARSVAEDEMLADATLMTSLSACGPDSAGALRRGLDKAVARGTLLREKTVRQEQVLAVYFMNGESGRQARDEARRSDFAAAPDAPLREPAPATPRPNIYQLYEENIGLLSPMIVEEIKDLEAEYPEERIAEAIFRALEQNKRRLSYIKGILQRWRDEGRDDGEPGRHSEENEYARAWEQYRTRRSR